MNKNTKKEGKKCNERETRDKHGNAVKLERERRFGVCFSLWKELKTSWENHVSKQEKKTIDILNKYFSKMAYASVFPRVRAVPVYSTNCDDDDGGLLCHVTNDSNYCFRMT